MSVAFKWSPASTERLRELIEVDRHSASQIATVLNKEFASLGEVSRNSVIGRASRLKFVFFKSPGLKYGDGPKWIQTPTKDRRKMPLLAFAPPPPAQPLPAPILALFPNDAAVSFEDLRRFHCRWPVDAADGEPLMYCGSTAEHGRSYCCAHMAVAYRPARLKTDETLAAAQ